MHWFVLQYDFCFQEHDVTANSSGVQVPGIVFILNIEMTLLYTYITFLGEIKTMESSG